MDNKGENAEAIDRQLRILKLIEESKKLDGSLEQNFDVSLDSLLKLIKDAEDINAQTNLNDLPMNTNQFVLDSTLLKMNFKHVSNLFTFLKNFNDNQMADAIKKVVFKDGGENWEELANSFCCLTKSVSLNGTMLGYVDAIPKQRVQQKRRPTKVVNAVEQKPNTVGKNVAKEKGWKAIEETHEQISALFKKNGYKPIPYYHLIIDPNDFSNTVQNSFNVSFLLREKALLIEDGPDGYLQVRALSAKERKEAEDNAEDTNQAICTLTMDLCNRLAVHYNIQEPLLNVDHFRKDDDSEEDE